MRMGEDEGGEDEGDEDEGGEDEGVRMRGYEESDNGMRGGVREGGDEGMQE